MIVLAVTWVALQGKEAEVKSTFLKLQAASRKESGCKMYIVQQHQSEPQRFLVYEQYDNDAALQAHRDSAHFQEYAAKILPQLGVRVSADFFRPLE